jgi:hypothetical protein
MALPRRPIKVNVHELLSGLAYVVIGGVATRNYMPERFTKDVDVLVSPSAFNEAQAHLRAKGWRELQLLHFSSDGLTLRGATWSKEDEEIDLITADAPWVEEAVATPAFDADGMRVVSLPFLILMKLDASRVQDTSDVARMLALADDETVDRARKVIRRYSSDSLAVEDFESLLQIGRWELEDSP